MITPEEFDRYEEVRQSGVTNMFDTRMVQQLTGLEKVKILEIMNDYTKLKRRHDATKHN